MTSVEIIEVGPRDGFQNISEYIPAEQKLYFIGGLIDAGLRHIQITSFVSPKAIPQLRDSMAIARACAEKYPDADLSALVPNLRGAQMAREAGIHNIAYVVSLSESHNKNNINRTHEQSIAELGSIRQAYPDMRVSADIGTAFGCPFEGKPEITQLLALLHRIAVLGIDTFNLCDTIGVADPRQVRDSLAAVRREFPQAELLVHIHDTRGLGIVNTLAAIEAGVTGVQSSIGGLGGCPFAPGASGNTATEDLVFMLESMGMDTGVDCEKLLAVAKNMHRVIKGNYSGHRINIA